MPETDLVAVRRASRSKPKKQRKPKKHRETIKSTTNWFDLPLDLKVNILSRVVAIEKLWNVQIVCKDWCEMCKDPSMWKVIYMDSELCSDCQPCPWPSDLHSSSRVWAKYMASHKMCRNAVDRSQGQLVDIAMVGFCNNELLEYVADRSPKLKRLEIAYSDSVENLSEALKKLPKLEELSIHHGSYLRLDQAMGSYCPELKTLRLNHCSEIGDEEIVALSENLRELRHIELHNNLRLSNAGLQAILDRCPSLEVLDLRLCPFVDMKGVSGKRLEQIECVLHNEPLNMYPYSGVTNFMDLKTWRKVIEKGYT